MPRGIPNKKLKELEEAAQKEAVANEVQDGVEVEAPEVPIQVEDTQSDIEAQPAEEAVQVEAEAKPEVEIVEEVIKSEPVAEPVKTDDCDNKSDGTENIAGQRVETPVKVYANPIPGSGFKIVGGTVVCTGNAVKVSDNAEMLEVEYMKYGYGLIKGYIEA